MEDPHPQQKTANTPETSRDEGEAMQRVTCVVQYNRPVMGLPCWPLPLFFFGGGEWGGDNQPWVSHVG